MRPPAVQLSDIGRIVDAAIREIPNRYPGVFLEKYIIMPNPIHLLLRLESGCERAVSLPTIPRVVKQLKETVTKQIGYPIWQKGYHDHIIRNQKDYDEIWRYIEENPIKWHLDRYYGS